MAVRITARGRSVLGNLREMAQGHTVTLIPVHAELTRQAPELGLGYRWGRTSVRGSRSILRGFLRVGSNFLYLGTPILNGINQGELAGRIQPQTRP